MYKRRIFTHTWKPMEDLAFVDPGSLERLMEPIACPRCGMSSMEWTADDGDGYVVDRETYCCRGCADGRGCTCHELASSERSLEIWQGVTGLSPEEEDEELNEEDDEGEVAQPFDRQAFTLNWHAERRTSEEAPAGTTDEDADEADDADEDADTIDLEEPAVDADAGDRGPKARRPKAVDTTSLDAIDVELQRTLRAQLATRRAPRPKPKRRVAAAANSLRTRTSTRRSPRRSPQPRAGQHSATRRSGSTRRAGAARRRSKRR